MHNHVANLPHYDNHYVPKNVPSYGHANYNHEARMHAVVQWLGRSLITRPARIQFPGWEARFIRCKNMALYIRDCESLCLSDGPFYLVSMPGVVKYPTRGKRVTCRGLRILT